MCPIKLPTEPIFWIFHIVKINKIMPFCNLFIGRPSYILAVIFNLTYLSIVDS